MDAIADRGHTALTWLLGLGLIAAWAALDQPPPVIDTAYGVVLRTIGRAESPLFAGDPLANLPTGFRTQLSQLRHEHFRYDGAYYQGAYQDCCRGLEPIEVEAVLAVGREVLKQADQSEAAQAKWFLSIEGLRRDLSRLEAWHHQGGLSSAATLGDLRTQLGSKIQVPGTEQSLDVPSCLVFVGLSIAGLQLYLLSLLWTMAGLPRDDGAARSWVVLHRKPLGPIVAILWVSLPAFAWFLAAVMIPLGRMESHPTALDWTIFGLIVVTLVPIPRLIRDVRRRHLSPVESPATIVLDAVRQAA